MFTFNALKPQIMPRFLCLIALLFVTACVFAAPSFTVSSPDKNIQFWVGYDQSGMVYRVKYKGELLVDNSRLSISFKEGGFFGRHISLGKPVFQKMEETYDLPVGKASRVHSLSNQATVTATEDGGLKRQIIVQVRVFNDGAAFRYQIPGQHG